MVSDLLQSSSHSHQSPREYVYVFGLLKMMVAVPSFRMALPFVLFCVGHKVLLRPGVLTKLGRQQGSS